MTFDPALYSQVQLSKHLLNMHDQKKHGRDKKKGESKFGIKRDGDLTAAEVMYGVGGLALLAIASKAGMKYVDFGSKPVPEAMRRYDELFEQATKKGGFTPDEIVEVSKTDPELAMSMEIQNLNFMSSKYDDLVEVREYYPGASEKDVYPKSVEDIIVLDDMWHYNSAAHGWSMHSKTFLEEPQNLFWGEEVMMKARGDLLEAAQFARIPDDVPTLSRGLALPVNEASIKPVTGKAIPIDKLSAGAEIDISPSSFSTDVGIAHHFSQTPVWERRTIEGNPEGFRHVVLQLKGKDRRGANIAPMSPMPAQEEWVVAGRYRVTNVSKVSDVEFKDPQHKVLTHAIEQDLDDTMMERAALQLEALVTPAPLDEVIYVEIEQIGAYV